MWSSTCLNKFFRNCFHSVTSRSLFSPSPSHVSPPTTTREQYRHQKYSRPLRWLEHFSMPNLPLRKTLGICLSFMAAIRWIFCQAVRRSLLGFSNKASPCASGSIYKILSQESKPPCRNYSHFMRPWLEASKAISSTTRFTIASSEPNILSPKLAQTEFCWAS